MTTRPSIRDVESLREAMAAAAQAVYDSWEQDAEGLDPELGAGGICDGIAEAMVSVVIAVAEGVFALDIPPSVYESGFGYNWRKKAGVRFTADHIVLMELAPDPAEFWRYTSDGEQPEDFAP